MENEERILVKKAQKGDDLALNKLIAQYDRAITKMSIYFENKFKSMYLDFEELKQDATIAFTKAVFSYDENKNKSLFYYTKTCMINKLISHIRSKRAKYAQIIPDIATIDGSEIDIPCDSPSPLDIIEKEIWIAEIKTIIIKLLTPNQIKVWDLHLEAYTYSEIAEKLEITVKKVDNTLVACKRKIRENQSLFTP